MEQSNKPCSSCPDLPDRITIIKTVSKHLTEGHLGLAEMYQQLANEMKDPEEKLQFQKAADTQRELANQSSFVTVPDVDEGGIKTEKTP